MTKEVCFIGRSNVGKSSLINAITNKNNLAIVSKLPGRTRLINFFQENQKIIVDLPGYGYSKISAMRKQEMDDMVFNYFIARSNKIVKVFQLIDGRIGPTVDDINMINFLKSHDLNVIAIITKKDKTNQSQLYHSTNAIKPLVDDLIVVSSHTGYNISHLRKIIDAQF